eukprot:337824-Prymnesium_polylepis.1
MARAFAARAVAEGAEAGGAEGAARAVEVRLRHDVPLADAADAVVLHDRLRRLAAQAAAVLGVGRRHAHH